MQELDTDTLARIAAMFTNEKHLTPAESAEVLRIARGFACKDSAEAANVSPETIRARRKRIYRKLAVSGAGEVLSALLALTLRQIAHPDAARPERETQARSADAGTVH